MTQKSYTAPQRTLWGDTESGRTWCCLCSPAVVCLQLVHRASVCLSERSLCLCESTARRAAHYCCAALLSSSLIRSVTGSHSSLSLSPSSPLCLSVSQSAKRMTELHSLLELWGWMSSLAVSSDSTLPLSLLLSLPPPFPPLPPFCSLPLLWSQSSVIANV